VNENCKAGQTIQKSVASEIIDRAQRVAGKSAGICDRAQSKLSPVMLSPRPTGCSEVEKQPREYPPFFSELRDLLEGIENSLDGINDALDRTEL